MFGYLTFFTIANTTGIVNNTAIFDPSTANQYDWNSTNDVAVVSTFVPTANTQLTKWFQYGSNYVSPPPETHTANYLDNLYAFVKLYNVGPDTAKYITVIDVFPAGLIYDTANMATSYDGGLTWILDALNNDVDGYGFPNISWFDAGSYYEMVWWPQNGTALLQNGTALLRIPFQVNSSNVTIVNNATEIQRTFNPDGNNTSDPPFNEPGFNTIYASNYLDIPPAVDIAVDKYGLDQNYSPTHTWNYGTKYPYRIWVSNNGPDNATGVTITDTLPVGVVFDHANSYGIGTVLYSSGTVTWIIGNMANGTAHVLDIFVNVTGHNTTITNNATGNSTQYDWNPANNIGSWTTNIPAASIITVSKEWRADKDGPPITTANYLDNVWAVLSAHNSGPDNVTTIELWDILPVGFTAGNYFLWKIDSGSWNNFTTPWITVITVTPLNFNSTIWIAIPGQITVSNTTINNTVNQTRQSNYNPLYPNGPPYGSASAQLNIPSAADIAVTKVFENTTGTPINNANYLDTVVAHLTVTNNGPNNATGVVLTDYLPLGFEFDPAQSLISYNQLNRHYWNLLMDVPIGHMIL